MLWINGVWDVGQPSRLPSTPLKRVRCEPAMQDFPK